MPQPYLNIISPANTMKNVEQVLRDYGEKTLLTMGFPIKYGQYIDEVFFNMAGPCSLRVADLYNALVDPHSQGVMPVYGGYNSNQLLPTLMALLEKNACLRKKWLVGYSDITALLVLLSQRTSIDCYHGPGFASFCDPGCFDYTKEHFLKAVSGKPFRASEPGFSSDDQWYLKENYGPRDIQKGSFWTVYQEGEITAPIMGGNIDTLCALAGTSYFPDLSNRILFLEDAVGNAGIFHRNMIQLLQMGVFDQIVGLIIGKFPSTSILNQNELLFTLLKDILPSTTYPILCHVHCSHVDPMLTIPLEKRAHLAALPQQPYVEFNLKST